MPTNKHRVAANLTDAEFGELAGMARQYDVSLGWLGRKAILEFLSRYRTQQLELPLAPRQRSSHLGTDVQATQ
jgi:hypothetical protein